MYVVVVATRFKYRTCTVARTGFVVPCLTYTPVGPRSILTHLVGTTAGVTAGAFIDVCVAFGASPPSLTLTSQHLVTSQGASSTVTRRLTTLSVVQSITF